MANMFSTTPIGGALTQPTAPVRGASAPEEQLGLWQKFRQKLATDPNFRMALLTLERVMP